MAMSSSACRSVMVVPRATSRDAEIRRGAELLHFLLVQHPIGSDASASNKDIVCYTCGASGFKHLLVRCSGCKGAAMHLYCLDKIEHDGSKASWLCDECGQRHDAAACYKGLLGSPVIFEETHEDEDFKSTCDLGKCSSKRTRKLNQRFFGPVWASK